MRDDRQDEDGDRRRPEAGDGEASVVRLPGSTEVSESAAAGLPEDVPCPFCDSRDTAPVAQFGSLLMTAHYVCNACRSTFDWARDESEG